MSPSTLRVLFIALFICTPVAKAVKCFVGGGGVEFKETDCGAGVNNCVTMSVMGQVTAKMCAMNCNVPMATCCQGDLCNADGGGGGAKAEEPATTAAAATTTTPPPPPAAPAAGQYTYNTSPRIAVLDLLFVAVIVLFITMFG